MNGLIRDAYDRGRPVGLLDRMKGATPLDENRAERFARYHADYESALKRGDEIAAAVADTQLDKVLAESRAARAEAASNVRVSTLDRGQSPAEQAPQFDGGVRGRRPVAPPGGMRRPESSRELFARAMRAATAERAA